MRGKQRGGKRKRVADDFFFIFFILFLFIFKDRTTEIEKGGKIVERERKAQRGEEKEGR